MFGRFVGKPRPLGAPGCTPPDAAPLIALQVEDPRAHDGHTRRMGQPPQLVEAGARVELSPEMPCQLFELANILTGLRWSVYAVQPAPELLDALHQWAIGLLIDICGQ